MRTIRSPIDARVARMKLRLYVLALPTLSLVGGWCALLQIAVVIAPEIVAHIPEAVRLLALFGALAWFAWVIDAVRRVPGVIDDILEHGLLMEDEPRRPPRVR